VLREVRGWVERREEDGGGKRGEVAGRGGKFSRGVGGGRVGGKVLWGGRRKGDEKGGGGEC